MRNGVTRLEAYSPAGVDQTAPLDEAGAAFVAALAAAMVDDRLLELGEPVAMTLGDWAFSPMKAVMLVRHLLSRTTGISTRSLRAQTVQDAIVAEPTTMPGTTFDPYDAGLLIFTEVARRKLVARGLEADPVTYLQRRVLEPVGAGGVRFERGPDGWSRLADGAIASAPAWAAYGELIRRGGVWRARWLVDNAALSEATVATGATSRYGFGWWLGAGAPTAPNDPLRAVTDLWDLGPRALPVDLLMAAGGRGQRLYIIPSRRLVAARLATSGADYSDAAFLRLLLTAA